MYALLRLALVAAALVYFLKPDESWNAVQRLVCTAQKLWQSDSDSNSEAPRVVFIRVKHGQTISAIARYWKSDANDIAALNKLANPDDIRSGQELRVIIPADNAATGLNCRNRNER